jgi:hypothetical protein
MSFWRSSFVTNAVSRNQGDQIARIFADWANLLWAGVDVMITIFCHFWKFWAKKLVFFSKTNVMINFLHNLA